MPISFSMKMATIFSFWRRRADLQPKEILQELRMISEQRESLFISDDAITVFISATSDAQEHFLLS